ncbi:FtsK/SpoIIIE domain-containing protein [Lysinibacillus fusiformis]|uniref:Cell division protein FtsK n=1 Tax=Lysinibacillus fusiformis TaxID=28031 RepID=A0A2I0V2P6_9BACI|nr:FtsK/SpoIIIE domain-containing protein [Lysinibacillus fusiformis]PKU52578.1 cell division protein FtsK [Lysinibacillus fusiformis]
MDQLKLIGKVAIEFLKQNIGSDDSEDGIARFLLDRLSSQQVSIICKEILEDDYLSRIVDIKIPAELAVDLPESIITNERTTALRHAYTDKQVLLLANNNDDQGPSLRNLFKIGANDLKANTRLWVKIASTDLPQINGSERLMKIWERALLGLLDVNDWSLENFSSYISLTRQKLHEDGATLISALGWALPALRIPRDSGYFYVIPESRQTYKNNWGKSFKELKDKRSYYLFKLTPNKDVIENEQLKNSFEEVKEYIPESIHPVIYQFIDSNSGWSNNSEIIANYEWESDNIGSLFTGIKVTKKSSLAEETREFLEDEFSELITDEDYAYLEILEKRKAKEPNDEDISFYDNHRREIETDNKLKAKWDKFIYGKPIECTDFLVGLIRAIERLFAQSETSSGKKLIKVKTQKGDRKSAWLDLHTDLGLYFSTRYKGLDQITSPFIEWDTFWLFKYDEFIENEQKKAKSNFKKNHSNSKGSRQIKFYIELHYEDAHGIEQFNKVQLIWEGNPNSIGLELLKDLKRLNDHPFQATSVSKNPISKKGKLQGISLSDIYTLQPVYRQNRGSLVGVYEAKKDIKKLFLKELEQAKAEGRIDETGHKEILESWNSFSKEYTNALEQWLSVGLITESHILQSNLYGNLISSLAKYAKGDVNRLKLWYPIMKLGVAEVKDTKPLAIIPPWHPMRIAGLSAKMLQLKEVVRYLLNTGNFEFGDTKLFFDELVQDIEHPYYPEICLGFRGQEVPEILAITDSLNDYSLMEIPIIKTSFQETNEDPKEASSKLTNLIERYLELQPHEGANLGVVLYNSDSTRLPLAIVDSIAKLNEKNNNIKCQVVLRHRDTNKLNQIYSKMVEGSDSDADMFVPSEVTNDFMAKLRIGVMAHQSSVSENEEGKPYDIVFLQDVISRHAEFDWIKVDIVRNIPDILELYPARWSRRRPAAKDELKSITYLVCPSQTAEGWEYLRFIKSITKNVDEESDEYYLPSRQITFQKSDTKNIFEESHKLGEWVANYDELLDRRLLKSQDVNVIKYQHNKTNGPNLVVSTTTSLKLLRIILKRKFKALNLGISDDEIERLSDYFINEANELSGDIVLRAAKIGRNANELIGVVLSKLIAKEEVQDDSNIGWYFLDDYANWLGKKEEQIADILAISPFEKDGKYYLQILVTEAKFVDIKNLSNSKKVSKKQLIDTVSRINNALFGVPTRLDRDIWLSKISDLLVEGTVYMQNSSISIERWRELIRSGEVEVELKGYSHVFVPSSSDGSDGLESVQIKINELDNGYQEVFSRESVRELLLSILNSKSLFTVRSKFANEVTWKNFTPSLPSENSLDTDNKIIGEEGDSGVTGAGQVYIDSEKQDKKETITTIDHDGSSGENVTPNSFSTYKNSDLNDWITGNINEEQYRDSDKEWLSKVVNTLKGALATYDLQGKVLDSRLTPNAAIIKLKGSDRLRIEDIEKKKSQLLTTHALNIINILPQPGEIVVFIERPERETISLANVWNKRKIKDVANDTNLNFVIGVKEIDGELLYLNLGGPFEGLEQHAPHTLIAGETGSGKSVLIQTLILDICATNSIETAKIYLIDPKYGVDYQNLEELPHLAEGIVIDQDRASEILEELVNEMEARYLKFREYRVPNLKEYNAKVNESERLPFIYLIHDEFADWMLINEYKNTVSSTVQRLGVKARAAGIHLIFAAQRPDKDALPVQLRDNLGNRLILKVGSTGTSEIALGEKGAENLLGRGHLAARLSGEPNLIFAQVPFIYSEEIYRLSKIIKG